MRRITKFNLAQVSNDLYQLGLTQEANDLIKIAQGEFEPPAGFDDLDMQELPGEFGSNDMSIDNYRDQLRDKAFDMMEKIKMFMAGNPNISRGQFAMIIDSLPKILLDFQDSLPDPI